MRLAIKTETKFIASLDSTMLTMYQVPDIRDVQSTEGNIVEAYPEAGLSCHWFSPCKLAAAITTHCCGLRQLFTVLCVQGYGG